MVIHRTKKQFRQQGDNLLLKHFDEQFPVYRESISRWNRLNIYRKFIVEQETDIIEGMFYDTVFTATN